MVSTLESARLASDMFELPITAWWGRPHAPLLMAAPLQTYTPEEAVIRKSIFAKNLKAINDHNALGLDWTKGVNKFADLTGDEWRARVSCLSS